MARNLDSSLSAALSNGSIRPCLLAEFQFPAGELDVWSGVGDLAWNGKTFKGVGQFGRISAIGEGTDVQADGLTVQLAGVPFPPSGSPSAPSIASPYRDAAQSAVTTNTTSVTLAVNQGELLVALIYADCYGVQPPALPTISGDSQGNSWNTDQSTTTTYIGGTGDGYILAHTTASATGNVTVSIAAPAGAGCGILLVRTNAYGFDAGGLAAGSIGTTSLTPSASASAYEAALVLALHANSVWTSSEGTQVFEDTAAGQARTGDVWEFTANPGTVSPTVGTQASNFPCAAVVLFANPPNTPQLNITEGIQLGAPTLLYFALLDDSGAFIGTPYLIWRGIADQPTVDVDTNTFTVTLALENPLTNLSRATCRRYTAADQRIFYPDDTGFNWVEMLNDAAFRWGS